MMMAGEPLSARRPQFRNFCAASGAEAITLYQGGDRDFMLFFGLAEGMAWTLFAIREDSANIWRGAIQTDAITLLFVVIRLAGSDLRLLRASGVCRPWPSRLPSRRFCG